MQRRRNKWVAFAAWLGIWLCLLAALALLMLVPGWILPLLLAPLVAWLAATRIGRQTWSATEVAIATIPQRLGSSSVVVVGIAGVVGVLVALLAMAAGFAATLQQSGSDDTAIVLRAGAQTELNSVLDHDTVTLVSQLPMVRHTQAGQPIASSELVVVAALPKRSTGLDANVEVRGVGERAWDLRPKLRLIAGRKFSPGLRELIVGKRALEQFAGVGIGSTLKLNGQDWRIVGEFEAGDANDSDLWGDFEVVGPAYRRGSSATSVTVRLTDASAFESFRAALATDPRIKVDVKTTRDYFNEQSAQLTKLINGLGTAIGLIMGIGAVFGALNSMYAAVAARTREIATLRAVGFRALPVIVSVMLETMLLATLGGAIGAAIAWLLFNNYTASTLGANFTQIVFAFQVTPELLWRGLKWALAIGLLGGLFPALRAARMSVTDGLREL
ncbi:MAG: ABC transporter permease [Proteobacteria bacterium]|nr:ABC transporter permease [Pseudomonadota bacterium]